MQIRPDYLFSDKIKNKRGVIDEGTFMCLISGTKSKGKEKPKLDIIGDKYEQATSRAALNVYSNKDYLMIDQSRAQKLC